MNSKYVKKVCRLLIENGVDIDSSDHQFVEGLEYEIYTKREGLEIEDQVGMEFEVIRQIDTKKVTFYGEVVEHFRNINNQDVPTHPNYYDWCLIEDLSTTPIKEIKVTLDFIAL